MTNHMKTAFAALALMAALSGSAAEDRFLWQIGQPDHNDAEFALAPASYSQFKDDGFYVVGESDPKRDWPYVHPGPGDAWAGSRSHTFTVVFGLKAAPKVGECQLQLDLLDTQGKTPPTLRIAVNGEPFERVLPQGAGDDSIFGQPAKGREHTVEVAFPVALLRAGNNRIEITTLTGSWVLYDRLALAVPEGVDAVPVSPFTELGSVSLQQGRLTASVIHAGVPVDAELSVDGQAAQKVRLTSGRQTIEIPVPAVEHARKSAVALTVDGRKVGQREVLLTPGVHEIIVVFKTHFDIGYTDMASNVVQTYRTKFMDSALKVVDESRALPPAQQFAWTIPGWPLHKMLEDWPGQSPERQQRVRQAVKEGRFVVHALPFTTHTELLEPEDIVRGLGYSTRLARELGLDLPRDAKMTDVPEHAAMMATLLQHAGVTFMHIGCNAMSGAPQVPPLYWWEAQRLAASHLARFAPHRRQSRPAPTRGGEAGARRRGQAPARCEGAHRAAFRFRRRDSRGESGPARRARRHAGHLDSRADVRSRGRSHRAQHPPAPRRYGGPEHGVAGLAGARAGGRAGHRRGV